MFIKFILIEYIHLLLFVFIIFALYINNMPVNFQFDKTLEGYVPETFTKEMAISYGIKDPEDSKLYKLLSTTYGVIRSFLSPNFKTMILKLVILIFIIGLAFDMKYSTMIIGLTIFVLIISAIFWGILYAAEVIGETSKDSGYYKFIQNNFNNIQADSWYIALVNGGIATSIIVGLYFLLHSDYIKKHSIITTSTVLLCMFILYIRVDGFLYFFTEGVWENWIKKYGLEWWKNMLDDSVPSEEKISRWKRWSSFVIYLLIFIMTILIQYTSLFKDIKKFSIFNELMDKTNHPNAILFLYAWFFLYRPAGEYDFLWFIIFIILTGGEVGYKRQIWRTN